MKVQLIIPVSQRKKKLMNLGIYSPSLTLAQLAAITPEDIELKVCDENLEDIDFESKPDLVGISVMTCQANRAGEISRRFKETGSRVVWGGIHPTFVNQDENPDIDSYVEGEAEEAWPQLLRDFQKGRLKRKYNGKPAKLETIPLPKRDFTVPEKSLANLIETAMASRGCCFSCSHCTSNTYPGVRWVSPERFAQDIGNTRARTIALGDSDFALPKSIIRAHLQAVKKFRRKYYAQIDPRSAFDPETAEILADGGVKIVFIGFESVNPENFNGNPKYIPPEHWRKTTENFHRYGIFVDGAFILGFDNDGKDIFEKTAKAIAKSGFDSASFSILTP